MSLYKTFGMNLYKSVDEFSYTNQSCSDKDATKDENVYSNVERLLQRDTLLSALEKPELITVMNYIQQC